LVSRCSRKGNNTKPSIRVSPHLRGDGAVRVGDSAAACVPVPCDKVLAAGVVFKVCADRKACRVKGSKPIAICYLSVGRVALKFKRSPAHRVQQLVANYKAKTIDWTEPARETAQSQVRKHITTRDSEITAVAYAWHAPGMPDKADICATDLIYIILGQKSTGRLHKVLVEENQWASNVDITYLTQQHPGLLVIRAAVLEKNELVVRKAILEQVERLVNEKVTEQELARAKLLLRTEYAFGNESYAGQVMSMGFYEGIDTYEFAIEYIDRVNLVTVDDIQAVARNMFQAGSYSLVILRREKDAPPAQEVKLLCPAAS